MKRLRPCSMCDNARVNPELHSDNDLSYIGVGSCERHYRILIQAGDNRPVTILFEQWQDQWKLRGYYIPKYCPNCGRELKENMREADHGTEE